MQSKLKIVITGVECSGKTTLCEGLANHFNTTYIKEYAREYITALRRPYTQNDLNTIVQEQQLLQNTFYTNHPITICDTDASVIVIWSQVKYGKCDEKIIQLLMQNLPDTYILPYYDIPFEADPLRETNSVDERKRLFNLYTQLLDKCGVKYSIVYGSQEERLKQTIEFLNLDTNK